MPQQGSKPPGNIVAKRLRRFNVKTKEDTLNCLITGIPVTYDGRILTVDRNNGTVKPYSPSLKLQSSLVTQCDITNAAIINEREAVICTEYSGCYLVIDISSDCLKIVKKQPMPFRAYASCRFNENLVAVIHDQCYEVKMFDRAGKVIWKYEQGQSLYPAHVIAKSDKTDQRDDTVIFTDQNLNAVLFIDGENGELKRKIRMKGQSAQGITMDSDGNFHIGLFDDIEVVLLNADLSWQRVILTNKDGLQRCPQAIAYDKNSRCLLISYIDSNFIDIFELL